MSEFVGVFPQCLESSFCKRVIAKFEADPRKYPGLSGDRKESTDLRISDLGDSWTEESRVFEEALEKGLATYRKNTGHVLSAVPKGLLLIDARRHHTGFQIQRTLPGQSFPWHVDSFYYATHHRCLAYIWYLNSLPEGEAAGGCTEFTFGKIRPEKGMLLLFPATWTYLHRGTPPTAPKYIVTGFLMQPNHDIKHTCGIR